MITATAQTQCLCLPLPPWHRQCHCLVPPPPPRLVKTARPLLPGGAAAAVPLPRASAASAKDSVAALQAAIPMDNPYCSRNPYGYSLLQL